MPSNGIGFCLNRKCKDHTKGTFLMNFPFNGKFKCPGCRKRGRVIQDHGHRTGDSSIFREVRVAFDYDAIGDRFTQIAICRDDSLDPGHNTYNFHTPMVKTAGRALKLAEYVLARLSVDNNCEHPASKQGETVISFDETFDDFEESLDKLFLNWSNSSLTASADIGDKCHRCGRESTAEICESCFTLDDANDLIQDFTGDLYED